MPEFEFIPTARDEGRVGVLEVSTSEDTYRFSVTWDDLVALRAAFADLETEILKEDH